MFLPTSLIAVAQPGTGIVSTLSAVTGVTALEEESRGPAVAAIDGLTDATGLWGIGSARCLIGAGRCATIGGARDRLGSASNPAEPKAVNLFDGPSTVARGGRCRRTVATMAGLGLVFMAVTFAVFALNAVMAARVQG